MANVLLIKGAIQAGTSKTGRKIIGILLSVIAFFLLVIIIVISGLISVFTPGNKNISSDFNAQDSQVYKDIRKVYDSYCKDVKKQMEALEEKYEEENMDYTLETVYNPETKKNETIEEWYCTVEISKKYEYISTAYVMAYLSCKYKTTYLSNRSYEEIDEKELKYFWDKISPIAVDEGDGEYEIYNDTISPEQIAEKFFETESDRNFYLESLYILTQMIGPETFDEIIDNVFSENKMNIPLYYQYASAWGNRQYGNGNIARNGCAPTCIAMVFSYLKGTAIYPDNIVEFTKNQYYVNGLGSSWDIFPSCAEHWGIKCNNIGKSASEIAAELEKGNPVILSMGPGIFTNSGHFIVITGITGDGKVYVNDPNDNNKKNHINREFNLSQIAAEAKGGWSFEQ